MKVNEYPVLNSKGDKVGTVIVPADTAEAIGDDWEYLSIQPTVLREVVAGGAIKDRLISFSMVVHPVVAADELPCGPCDCEDCTGVEEIPCT